MAVDVNALNAEVAAVKAGFAVSWSDLKVFLRAKITEAAAGGGVVSYVIAGRTVTKSLAELREMLDVAEARAGGGLVAQLGEFAP